MMGYYEIIIIYDKYCGDVICFKYNGFVNDSNDIVTVAIEMGFIGEENRKQVRWARSLTEYEYKHIK